MHNLANFDGVFMIGILQVFPMEIVIIYAIVHQHFWCVTEPSFWNDAIAAEGVLSWFLQVENAHDIFIFELFDDVKLIDKSIAESLGANQEIVNNLRVKPLNVGWWSFHQCPVFMLTPLTSASNGTM